MKVKAYWLRFWHSWWFTFTFKELDKDHRMYTEYIQSRYLVFGRIPYKRSKVTCIGCCCGKSWYGEINKELGIIGTNNIIHKKQQNKQ